MIISIRAAELRKALADLEAAERHGFMYCEGVFEADGLTGLGNLRLRYSDMWEKAHPTVGSMDWGRHQGVSRRHKFVDGELIVLESARKQAV